MMLEDAEKNGTEAKRKLPDTDYSQFRVPRRTRASDCCMCRWCRPRTYPAPTDTPTVAKCQYCHTVRGHGVPLLQEGQE